MPVYAYTARTKEGEVKHGTLEASSEAAAKAWMYSERLLLVGLKEKKPSLLKREIRVPFLKGRVKAKELLAFTRQLAAMIEAGLPLLTALGTLRKEERNPYFAKVLSDIIAEVEGGASLHDALGAHPKVFDEVYAGTVEAGESSGILGRVLGRLATHIEKALAIKRRIRGAIVYPSVLAVLSLCVILLFLIWVIPSF
jgi:type IV pilus assembly protein PilC